MARLTGYDKLSWYMAEDKYAIFRRFKVSGNRDLLYLQAELVQLEEEFAELATRDRGRKGEEEEKYDKNWQLLSTSKKRRRDGAQWAKALEIRAKLREYYTCVTRYATIIKLPAARQRDVRMLNEWIRSPDLGGGIGFSGSEFHPATGSVYSDMHSEDLLILNDRAGEDDPFTRLLAGPVFHGLERFWRVFKTPVPSDPEDPNSRGNLFRYSDSHVIGVIDMLGTALASMTPLVSIIVLYFVTNLGARLGVVCACTFAFSMALGVVTKARRIEIFACTAAFASVQVVFIGNTNNLN